MYPRRKNQEQLNLGFCNSRFSTWPSLTNTPRFFELFEPVVDVVHTLWFPSKFLPELSVNTHQQLCLCKPQDTLHFFFICKHYQQHATAPTRDRQTDTETLWPWASIRWGHLMCKKIIWVMESSVATFTVLHCWSPILLIFNILPFFQWKPCINPQSHFNSQ